MIYKNGKEVTAMYIAGYTVNAVYKGAKLVWEAINSCFGAGYWRGDKPWIGSDGWKNLNKKQ